MSNVHIDLLATHCVVAHEQPSTRWAAGDLTCYEADLARAAGSTGARP